MDQSKASGKHPEGHPLYAPGLKWRARIGGDVPMWYPRERDVKAGYIPKSLTLAPTDSQADIAAACRKQWQDLEDWRAGKPKPIRYTISWLIDRFQTDETSPFQALDSDTQTSYRNECRLIRATVGERRIDPKLEGGVWTPRVTGEDFRRWHKNWGHQPGKRPTPSRATHAVAMLRGLFSYNVEIATNGAGQIREILSAMRFKKQPARDSAPERDQVYIFAEAAIEAGYRSIAMANVAQFELTERRIHIIGKWRGNWWGYGWMWDGHVEFDGKPHRVGVTPGWRITYYQTKKGANLRDYDLVPLQWLLSRMQETPKEQRRGAIIVCEDTGQPWKTRAYQKKFREIARAAGLPDDFQSRDMRASGMTEADDIPEITPRMLQDGAGHADLQSQEPYRRGRQRNANKVVAFRQAAQKKNSP